MKKTKNIISAILCVLLAFTLFGVMSTLCRHFPSDTPSDSPTTPPVANYDYSIRYCMVVKDTEQEVYEPLFKKDGEYPVGYNEGDTITVSDLNGKVTKTPVPESWGVGEAYFETGDFTDPNDYHRSFGFYGWFLDSACTVAVSDNTLSDMSGDITLYAKISISIWTDFY